MFRKGQNDDRPDIQSDPMPILAMSLLCGSFLFRWEMEVLKKHVETAAGNAVLNSKTVQNELICI